MVFIHGGGFLIDTGSRPRTNGGLLAESGEVVVVTIEYRMGAFGFLYTPGISPNLGLQDQVCALEWIQRHIGDFGGDPANVTIFGESAGATSVAYLMVMPSAKGLFHKAILESGAFPFESQKDNRRFAETGTRKFFKELGLAVGDLSSLQRLPDAEILREELRQPEEIEPPNGICHEFCDCKSPGLFVLQEAQPGDPNLRIGWIALGHGFDSPRRGTMITPKLGFTKPSTHQPIHEQPNSEAGSKAN